MESPPAIRYRGYFFAALIIDIIADILGLTGLLILYFVDEEDESMPRSFLKWAIPIAVIFCIVAQYFGWKGYREGKARYVAAFGCIKVTGLVPSIKELMKDPDIFRATALGILIFVIWASHVHSKELKAEKKRLKACQEAQLAVEAGFIA